MKSFKKSRLALSVLATTAIFAGCGGGGGGSGGGTTTTAPSTGSPTTFQASSIDSAAPPSPTYLMSSEELSAFNLLNAERLACGFGAVKQSVPLDVAALNHTNWMGANNYASGHVQEEIFSSGPTAGQPTVGFTGVNPINRTLFTGYAQPSSLAITDEGYAYTGIANKANFGAIGIRGLLTGPYHMAGMLGEFRDVGITVRTSAVSGADITAPAGSAPRTFLWANLGWTSSSSPQLLSSTDVTTYPCQGTSGTAYRLTNETPNPVPGRDLLASPLGHPVFIMGRVGNTIAITSAQMTQVSNGALVGLRTPITSANDPVGPCGRGCYLSHMAYVIPDAALLPNTQYQVNITGTNNGVAFTRSFTFTTGATSA